MIAKKHNVKALITWFSNIMLLIITMPMCIQPSSATITLPPFAESIREEVFPTVTVTITNDASHGVYLKCGFDGVDQGLRRLEPGQMLSATFLEILFPLRWCYVHINNEIRGAFWAFSVTLRCTDCKWRIKDDGAYHFRSLDNFWEKHQIFRE